MKKDKGNIIISYEGQLSYETINELLDRLNQKLAATNYSTLCRKRIYSTAVETLENIFRHSCMPQRQKYLPKFYIYGTSGNTFIESCNLVTVEQRRELETKIGYINDNIDRLKKIFAEKLKNSNISDEGGAGLGVYIIGKNSSQKISYTFEDLNEKESYFCLKIKI